MSVKKVEGNPKMPKLKLGEEVFNRLDCRKWKTAEEIRSEIRRGWEKDNQIPPLARLVSYVSPGFADTLIGPPVSQITKILEELEEHVVVQVDSATHRHQKVIEKWAIKQEITFPEPVEIDGHILNHRVEWRRNRDCPVGPLTPVD